VAPNSNGSLETFFFSSSSLYDESIYLAGLRLGFEFVWLGGISVLEVTTEVGSWKIHKYSNTHSPSGDERRVTNIIATLRMSQT